MCAGHVYVRSAFCDRCVRFEFYHLNKIVRVVAIIHVPFASAVCNAQAMLKLGHRLYAFMLL